MKKNKPRSKPIHEGKTKGNVKPSNTSTQGPKPPAPEPSKATSTSSNSN